MVEAVNDLVTLADAWDMHDGGGWWVVMMVAMLLFWALVIAGVVWLIRASGRAKGAMDLLDERLATGDISIEDYERRREILAGGRSPPHA